MILGALFNRDMHFLARGDAFRKPTARKLLEALHNIPIFRISEGKENMGQNDETFERCRRFSVKMGLYSFSPKASVYRNGNCAR
ncbi:hypothetical protein MKQ70_22870 [Chitinophaga sedimenti]|uniref:hypothetical protein n=1 Tax=Chitinophaga sedimenti TaxID=2033606 RepID=UPI0020053A48|nr:hypothetical protein [Chitinophaga sedimenti]MCK7557692.1 hypothetical protein [Chitinophaga sedimenti]